jgi:hypothetical protein
VEGELVLKLDASYSKNDVLRMYPGRRILWPRLLRPARGGRRLLRRDARPVELAAGQPAGLVQAPSA